jgi:hypothetical protein
MNEIDRPTTVQPSGKRGLIVRISPIAMRFIGVDSNFAILIDGHDLILSKETDAPGEIIGWYKYGNGKSISLPQRWTKQEDIKPGTKIRKLADSYEGRTIIRLKKNVP